MTTKTFSSDIITKGKYYYVVIPKSAGFNGFYSFFHDKAAWFTNYPFFPKRGHASPGIFPPVYNFHNFIPHS